MGGNPPDSTPGTPGGPARLQLELGEVLDHWARETNNLGRAENIDRLAGDAALVMDMALEGYDGPVWEMFANELAKYAFDVLCSWMGTDKIYAECARKGRPVERLGRPFPDEEPEGLAADTVAEALSFFRTEVLMKNKWDSTRGATLRTYFIGQCIFRFVNIYRLWLAKQEPWAVPSDRVEALRSAGMTPGPERHVVPGLMAEYAFTAITSPRVRKAMWMTADGWSQADIGAELGVSEKAVERLLGYARDQLRAKGIA